MKKVLSIILLLILISSLFILTGCSKKEEAEKANTSKTTQNNEPKFSWPDLKEYNIPTLAKGKISDLVDKSNKDGYKLNYDITVNSIQKSDIEEYIKSFDSSWSSSETDNTYIVVSSDGIYKYSVVIMLDEENNTANIAISSL